MSVVDRFLVSVVILVVSTMVGLAAAEYVRTPAAVRCSACSDDRWAP